MYTNTTFNGAGSRRAGLGICYDRYDDESARGVPDERYIDGKIRFPNDHVKPNDLNGPVIIVKKGKINND